MVNYFKSHNLYNKYQYCFRASNSTHDAVFRLVNDVYDAKDARLHSVVCFLDIKKAFNCVEHGVLLDNLWRMGVRGQVLRWFDDFLSGRTQYVDLNGRKSEKLNLVDGVPQGSVLGPILYLVYVNFISELDLPVRPLLFADDTALMVKGKTVLECEDLITKALTLTSFWLKSLKLTLNLDKCKLMYMNNYWVSTPQPLINVCVDNVSLEVVNEFKYLGIVIDKNISFKSHASKTIRDTWSKLSLFGRIRYCLPDETALNLFKSMILPILEFGNIFSIHCPVATTNKLQRLQNKGIKIALRKDSRYPTTLLHVEANMSSFAKRAEIAQNILAYRYIMKEFDSQETDVRGIRKTETNTYTTLGQYGTLSNICNISRLDPNILNQEKINLINPERELTCTLQSNSSLTVLENTIHDSSFVTNTDENVTSLGELSILIQQIEANNSTLNRSETDTTSKQISNWSAVDDYNIGNLFETSCDINVSILSNGGGTGSTSFWENQKTFDGVISTEFNCNDTNVNDQSKNDHIEQVDQIENLKGSVHNDITLSLPYDTNVARSETDLQSDNLVFNSSLGATRFFCNLEDKTRGQKGLHFYLDGHACKTKSYVDTLCHKVKRNFNNLPLEIRMIENYRTFKDRVKHYLKNQNNNFPT